MRNKIGIIVPLKSNGVVKRAEDLTRFIRSWQSTTSGFSHLLLVPEFKETQFYFSHIPDGLLVSPNVFTDYNESRTVVGCLNHISNLIVDDYEIIAFMNDDFIIQTPGWEEEIIKWQEENKGICWGNDLIQGENLTTHFFMHNSIVKALGFVAPSCMEHFYIDNYWTDLGILIGKRKYFPDLIFEHRHYSNNKNKKDSVYEEGESVMGKDKKAFDEYRARGLQVIDAEIVKKYQKNHNI